MRKRVSHAERNAETRRRLLSSARRLFLRKGFYATSLADVAMDAGFTKGAVFSQFDSKADLFLALLELRSTERLEQLEGLRSGVHTASSLVQSLTTDWHDNVSGDRAWTLLVIEFRVYAARNRSASERYAAIHSRTCARMADVYKSILSRAGLEVVLDLDTLARVVLGLSAGLVLEQDADPALDVPSIMAAIGRGMFRGERRVR